MILLALFLKMPQWPWTLISRSWRESLLQSQWGVSFKLTPWFVLRGTREDTMDSLKTLQSDIGSRRHWQWIMNSHKFILESTSNRCYITSLKITLQTLCCKSRQVWIDVTWSHHDSNLNMAVIAACSVLILFSFCLLILILLWKLKLCIVIQT